MPAKDLGSKFVCFKCETRFYDLKKPEPLCPKCGADQRQSPALKSPPTEKRSRAKPAPVPEAVEAVEVDEAEVEEVEDAEVEEDEADETDDE